MNIQQIKAVFDSLNIETRLVAEDPQLLSTAHHIVPKLYVAPWSEDWHQEHPRAWKIFKMGKIGEDYKIQATVADEFELQDWLINEFTTS